MKMIPKTLCIIHQHPNVLLGMKKRGYGVGKWNGFGGKLEDGETVMEAAVREMEEECGIKIDTDDLELVGILDFQFQKSLEEIFRVHVFRVTKFVGEPQESEEMKPQWFSVDEIPFGSMWSSDPFWLPLLLEGKKFRGSFLFDDNDEILEKKLEEVSEL